MRFISGPDTRSASQRGLDHNRLRHFFLYTGVGTPGKMGCMSMSTFLCFLVISLPEPLFMTGYACCSILVCLDSQPQRRGQLLSRIKRSPSYEQRQRVLKPNPTLI